ncbi:nuclear transport factor 2 family protein [Flavobacterium aquiphilum]|uniref:nuclear transport factor 2 family protein n=1 Tax=Flavobacterium aquiphilum TaxID=3003261 RepID=UPI0024817A83|nr:nuclear transport factor 2 family protein [Flavobacterium aquiphilum]
MESFKNQMSSERAVQQVLAQYVRAVDKQDGDMLSNLFTADGKVEIYDFNAENPILLFTLNGKNEIANAISTLMLPHPKKGWSHHTTHDHIISVNESDAEMDAQFIRFDSVGATKPENGWPSGTIGLMGTVTPTESGYYKPSLKKIEGEWKMVTHRIYHDLTFAFPE